jgi:hypothetical protein
MKRSLGLLTLLLPFQGLLLAQNWEVGGSAGYNVNRNLDAVGPTISGKAGFAPGVAFGAYLGNNSSRHIGGEVRYTYLAEDLKVTSGSAEAKAGAQSHALHYDVLVHATSRDSAVRPFLAVGGGVKLFRGTGTEPAFQPLSSLVVLTRTTQAEPLISVGAGVKFKVSRKALFRIDFRDYATPTPDKLLATPRATTINGWMHDLVGLVGISAAF